MSRSVALSVVLFLCAANLGHGAAVDSTFVGLAHNGKYSDPANWSPAEVPNNSGTETFNVTIYSLDLDMDATVSNLTIGDLFSPAGYSYTVLGSTTLATSATLNTGPLPSATHGSVFAAGNLTNFDAGSRTLQSGSYDLIGIDGLLVQLQFIGADIVNNAADIYLRSGGRVVDEQGRDGLRNFAHNLANGSMAVARDNYTLPTKLTNDGSIFVDGGSLTVTGGLTNYNATSHTLTGGYYYVISRAWEGYPEASFGFAGADIIHNAAGELYIQGGTPGIKDEQGNNGLRNFADNQQNADVYLLPPASFTGSSDFTNKGRMHLYESTFSLPSGRTYHQAGGYTEMTSATLNANVDLQDGVLFAGRSSSSGGAGSAATINGDFTMSGGLLPEVQITVNGSVGFSGNARWRRTLSVKFPDSAALNVSNTLTMGGTLEAKLADVSPPGSQTRFTMASAKTITGSFANADANSRIPTTDGKGTFAVSTSNGELVLTDYQRTQPAAQMLNMSARAGVLTGDKATIAGFIIVGTEAKTVLIRGVGPSLTAGGVPGALQDPTLELHDTNSVIATNDNWRDTQGAAISQTGVAPTDARESAILITLQPAAYTAVMRGANATSGVGLVEMYDLSSNTNSKLANMSTRAFVDADHVLIGGAIAGGPGTGNAELVVRAIGAGLKQQGVTDCLPDPMLEVRNSDGSLVAANDDASTGIYEGGNPLPPGLAPADPDAAIAVGLAPGNYTVIVRGKNGASGNALVEIYDLNGGP
jgi:hypothetical protein